ncbi:MAG: T9SS type A sorting domain-containing protein [Chitinophagaceae bacterium]
MKKIFTVSLNCLCFFAIAQTPQNPAAAFIPGNIVAYRAGDGGAALANPATAVFLVEYTPAGTIAQSIAMPTVASASGNRAVTCSGNATAEGLLTRSQDGRYLLVPGYNQTAGTPGSVVTTTSAAVNRVVARVDAAGNINSTTALSDAFSAQSIRGAASTDGTDIWISNSGTGVRYTTFGSNTSVIISNSPTTLRSVFIYDNQLYVGTNTAQVATVGMGLPTTPAGDVAVGLPGLASAGAYQFFFADLNPAIPGYDVLYVADDQAIPTGGLQKYSFDGTTWNSNGVLNPPIPTGLTIKGLTGYVTGTTVTLYSCSATNIYATTDASGYNTTISGSFNSIATAPANTAFRGLAQAPLPVALPLDLTSFTASLIDKNVQLNWATHSEQNVRSFSIERSADGRAFSAIGDVLAKNTPNASYVFSDNAPLNGINYYRLKMIDRDGSFKISAIVSVSNRKGIVARVFPNPVINNLIVSHTDAGDGASIKIYNASGQLVRSFSIQPGATQTSLPVSELVKGNYLLSFESKGEKTVTRFTKE